MNKNQFSRILANKLDLLEESNITELIEKGNYKEANDILSQLEYKTLSSYIKDKNHEKLQVWEIENSHKITFIWYLFGATHQENDGNKETDTNIENELIANVESELIANVEMWRKNLRRLLNTKIKSHVELAEKVLNKLEIGKFIKDFSTLEELVK